GRSDMRATVGACAASSTIGIALLVSMVAAHAGDSLSDAITIGPNIQISASSPTNAHYEAFGCADPVHPSAMVVGVMRYDEEVLRPHACVCGSQDDGRTWRLPLPAAPGESNSADPACTFDARGRAFFVRIERSGSEGVTAVYRSADGGRTWSEPTKLQVGD